MCSPKVKTKYKASVIGTNLLLVNKPCLKEHYLGVLDPWFLETLVGDTEQGSKKVEIILVIDK